jgi:hypothetical protein
MHSPGRSPPRGEGDGERRRGRSKREKPESGSPKEGEETNDFFPTEEEEEENLFRVRALFSELMASAQVRRREQGSLSGSPSLVLRWGREVMRSCDLGP